MSNSERISPQKSAPRCAYPSTAHNCQDVQLPPVVQAGLAHYQFETLHPYSDGNGRIGRLAIVLQLIRLGVLRDPILVVSPWFEARRIPYQDALHALSITGDWNAWIAFLAKGVDGRHNPPPR